VKTARFAIAGIVALAVGVGSYLTYRTWAAPRLAPNIAYTLLDGSRSTIDELRGKVVLVNFWATDCAPCVREMPQIAALHERFKARGYDTLAVAMRYDPPALVVNFAEARKLPFGVVIDNTGAFAQGFDHVQFTPTSVLINRRGEIVKRFIGEVDFDALPTLVERLLSDA